MARPTLSWRFWTPGASCLGWPDPPSWAGRGENLKTSSILRALTGNHGACGRGTARHIIGAGASAGLQILAMDSSSGLNALLGQDEAAFGGV